MNQADKAEAIKWIKAIFQQGTPAVRALDELHALIERQDDTDGEMWRFCVENGFPERVNGSYLVCDGNSITAYATANEATAAAMLLPKDDDAEIGRALE